MSLLSICQEIIRDSKLVVPNNILGNNKLEAIMALSAVNNAMIDLSKRHDWQSLESEYSFHTQARKPSYSLPDNFERMIENSIFTNYGKSIKPISASKWQSLANNNTVSLPGNNNSLHAYGSIYYRIRGRNLNLFPTPSSNLVISYAYISNYLVKLAKGGLAKDWQSDEDSPALDPHLVTLGAKWRFRKANGADYKGEYAEFQNITSQAKLNEMTHGRVFSQTLF